MQNYVVIEICAVIVALSISAVAASLCAYLLAKRYKGNRILFVAKKSAMSEDEWEKLQIAAEGDVVIPINNNSDMPIVQVF